MERNYEAERLAKEATERGRKAGANGFRFEYDERTDSFWTMPAANGAILTTGKTPEAAAERLASAGAAMLAAAKGESADIGLGGVDWSGGRVFVTAESNGYAIEHEPANGGRFGVHWSRTRKGAIAAAEERAKRFGAAIFLAADIVSGI